MKSNLCELKKGGVGLNGILEEIEKVTAYNGLPRKEALRLRLLAEELTGMLKELVRNFDGVFWLQNEGGAYELCVRLYVERMDREKKESLIAVAASGKNAAAKGFMGKIREVAENMLIHSDSDGFALDSCEYVYDYNGETPYTYAWTLDNYTSKYRYEKWDDEEKEKSEEWDRLEKSIVAKLADDVIVGVRGKNVDIIIKKEFKGE